MKDGRNKPSEDALGELGTAPMTPGLAFRVALPNFEGPLDLLLHLIREHKLDIFDIPISLITEKYLESLDRMQEINLDIAGEFLVMAATLAHIKSRLLLPRQDLPPGALEVEAEEERDPRTELVRRLLEYQKYKEAAETLARQDILDRDVFPRRVKFEDVVIPTDESGLVEISIYRLIEALDRILKSRTPEAQHEVVRERVSLSAAMSRIAEILKEKGSVDFFLLFEERRTRQEVVITFLALLEMCKLRLVRIRQDEGDKAIFITAQGDALTRAPPEVDESDYA